MTKIFKPNKHSLSFLGDKTNEEMRRDLEERFDLWTLMREANRSYTAIEGLRKDGIANEFNCSDKIIRNAMILESMGKKFELGERIEDPLEGNTATPEVLDYCFSNFYDLGSEAKFNTEIYSPLQILPRITQFILYISQHGDSKFNLSKDGQISDTGCIGGNCFVKVLGISDKLKTRNLYFPVNERSGVRTDFKDFIVYPSFFHSKNSEYKEELSSRGIWKGNIKESVLELQIN